MWQCVKCREEVEDSFEVCWNCGTSREGIEDPTFQKAEDVAPAPEAEQFVPAPEAARFAAAENQPEDEAEKAPLHCLRCETKLDYVGAKSFHEGMQWGVLGNLAELFVNREHFDIYCCPKCGHVEFFMEGIGEASRPR